MNRVYNKNNSKDSFIINHFLPEILQRINEKKISDEVIENIALMYIFPYKNAGEIRIGSLNEPNVSWYFASKDGKSRSDTESYRIIAEEALKPDQYELLRQIFLSKRLINDFSDSIVIEDLITRMSKETDYTENWWRCAYDVFMLYNPEDFNMNLAAATDSIPIGNSKFLFDKKYKGYYLKDDLINLNVFEDIVTPISKSNFWDKLLPTEINRAYDFLKMLGVPCTFVNSKGIINLNICALAMTIGKNTDFPVADNKKDASMCKLMHSLFMDVIYKESPQAFYTMINPVESNIFYKGIPVLNTLNEYVPLSWDLFYSKEEIVDDLAHLDVEIVEDNNLKSYMEYLHIAVDKYDADFIENYDNIHEFSEVTKKADEYNIDEDETMDFYKWVWSYSRHTELAENILRYLTGSEEQRNTVNEEDKEFVLSVLQESDIEDHGYCFNFDLNAEEAFEASELINNISYSYEKIFPVIYGDQSKLETGPCLERILKITDASYGRKSEIEQDDIWNHVYISKGSKGRFDNLYLKGKIYNEYDIDHYEDAVFLWNTENEDSYVVALAKFVNEYFNEKVDIEAGIVDWREEYNRLAVGIEEFLLKRIDRKTKENMYGNVADMRDIKNYGEEKKLWLKLKNQRDTIINYEGRSLPVDLDLWRSFLISKYKGRCQLCGEKIITQEQYAHFDTYRIIKQSENKLANMYSNMFCLCPSCRGKLAFGEYMGQDMHELLEKTAAYVEYMETTMNESVMEDNFQCLVQETWEEQELTREEEEQLKGFHNPIVCHVMVNGEDRCIAFSWEHFISLAFILWDARNMRSE